MNGAAQHSAQSVCPSLDCCKCTDFYTNAELGLSTFNSGSCCCSISLLHRRRKTRKKCIESRLGGLQRPCDLRRVKYLSL